jgi:hypothetical protein
MAFFLKDAARLTAMSIAPGEESFGIIDAAFAKFSTHPYVLAAQQAKSCPYFTGGPFAFRWGGHASLF